MTIIIKMNYVCSTTENKTPSFQSIVNGIITKTLSQSFTKNKLVSNAIYASLLAGLAWFTSDTSKQNPDTSMFTLRNFAKIKYMLGLGYSTCIIHDETQIKKIEYYMNKFPKFFDIIDISKLRQTTEPITFRDTSANVHGTIQIKKTGANNYYLVITYRDEIGNGSDTKNNGMYNSPYVQHMMELFATESKKLNALTLYNVNICDGATKNKVMYFGNKRTQEELENLFIKTLFHKDVDTLWQRIKDIHFSPQKIWNTGVAPRINLLLHGPPGTGKSTFAYRVAMATGRHIVNIKLNKFTKDGLWEVFQHVNVNTNTFMPEEVVYVLDEFDIDIDNILLKSECRKQQLAKISTTIDKFFDKNVDIPISVPSAPNTKDHNTKNKVECETGVKTDKEDSKNPNETGEELAEINSGIKSVSTYLDTMTSTYDKINTIGSNIIKIEDLLTIFQGAVPIERCIIIAMTNKYDELCKKCPALFRPGRLTPVYFGNFDMELLNKVSHYYFGKNISCSCSMQTEINISPSHVMEVVMNSLSLADKKHENFVKKLNEILEHKITSVSGEDVPEYTKNNYDFTLFSEKNRVISNSGIEKRKVELYYNAVPGTKTYVLYDMMNRTYVTPTAYESFNRICYTNRGLSYFDLGGKAEVRILNESVYDNSTTQTIYRGTIEYIPTKLAT